MARKSASADRAAFVVTEDGQQRIYFAPLPPARKNAKRPQILSDACVLALNVYADTLDELFGLVNARGFSRAELDTLRVALETVSRLPKKLRLLAKEHSPEAVFAPKPISKIAEKQLRAALAFQLCVEKCLQKLPPRMGKSQMASCYEHCRASVNVEHGVRYSARTYQQLRKQFGRWLPVNSRFEKNRRRE